MRRLPGLFALAVAAGLLASCSSKPVSPMQQPSSSTISGPSDYSRPSQDGAPWWDVDVSQIPDAVPTPHFGPVKASPYTVLGKTYYPIGDGRNYRATGTASSFMASPPPTARNTTCTA